MSYIATARGLVDLTPAEQADHDERRTPAFRATLICATVDSIRDARIAGGFSFEAGGESYEIQSRQSDRENILGLGFAAAQAIAAGAQPGDLRWLSPGDDFRFITATNDEIPMDAFTVAALYARGLAHKASLTYFAKALKDQVRAAEDPTAVDILTGWPE